MERRPKKKTTTFTVWTETFVPRGNEEKLLEILDGGGGVIRSIRDFFFFFFFFALIYKLNLGSLDKVRRYFYDRLTIETGRLPAPPFVYEYGETR